MIKFFNKFKSRIFAPLWCILAIVVIFPIIFFTQFVKPTIPIFFNIDNHYTGYMAVTMVSILQNTKNPIHFYVMHSGLSDENIEKLEKMKAMYNFKIDYIQFDSQQYSRLRHGKWSHIPRETMMRLYVTDYVTEWDKIVFLDADLIVLSDIADLYNTDIRNYSLAAVLDPIYPKYHNTGLFSPDIRYFNTGVMVINLKKWRQEHIKEKIDQKYTELKNLIEYPEQDLINIVLEHQIKELPGYYNILVALDYLNPNYKQKMLETPHILHWAGDYKPWNSFRVSQRQIFWDYARFTPFYNDMLAALSSIKKK